MSSRRAPLFILAFLLLAFAAGDHVEPAVARDASAEHLWQRGAQYFDAHEYSDAITVLEAAAKQGHPRAQALLGIIYQDGDGVPANDRTAAKWYKLAAAQGHRASEYALGGMYEEGDGDLPKDVGRAAKYYLDSARRGYDKAQFALGISYEFGQGVERNRDTAVYWLDKAGAQGEGRAQWVAQWLRRPATPRFARPEQLGAYISATVTQHYQQQFAGSGGECNLRCKMEAASRGHDAEVRNAEAGLSPPIPPANPN